MLTIPPFEPVIPGDPEPSRYRIEISDVPVWGPVISYLPNAVAKVEHSGGVPPQLYCPEKELWPCPIGPLKSKFLAQRPPGGGVPATSSSLVTLGSTGGM